MTTKGKRYPVEVRERAVRLVLEHRGEYQTEWAAITSIAQKCGMTAETLRKWVRQTEVDGLATGTWHLDPARSSVEFHVRHFYGLMTVKGHFDSYHGSLDLSAHPAVELVIDADSLNTKQKQRDKHLRSDDFFDVANHPQVRFEADTATLDGNTLKASGQLHAAGKHIPLHVEPPSRPSTASSRSRAPRSPISASSE